jgi:hypothetical protein
MSLVALRVISLQCGDLSAFGGIADMAGLAAGSTQSQMTLVFFERWADRDALLKHFALPASRELVRSLQTLAAGPTTLELFDASKIEKL